MDLVGLIAPAFWESDRPVVLAPPHLRGEGEVLQDKLGTCPWAAGAVVFASSGSTGAPKWILHTRASLLASARMVNKHLEVTADDCGLLALPLFHVGGVGVVARALVAGNRCASVAGKWSPRGFAEVLEESGATLTSLVPTQIHDLVNEEIPSPARVRAVVVGGGTLEEELGSRARALGWPVLQSYGMTEAGSQVATAPLASLVEEFRNEALDLLSDWQIRLSDAGVLEISGPALFGGYIRWDGDEISLDDPREGGWFATRDVVKIEGGTLSFVGRSDRQVKVRGELVDLDALEGQLQDRFGLEAPLCLLAVEDDRVGNLLVPVVAGVEEEWAQGIVNVVNEGLPKFSRLENVMVVRELPRTALGKVDYYALALSSRNSVTSRLPKL